MPTLRPGRPPTNHRGCQFGLSVEASTAGDWNTRSPTARLEAQRLVCFLSLERNGHDALALKENSAVPGRFVEGQHDAGFAVAHRLLAAVDVTTEKHH